MKFLIADSFNDSLRRLTGDEQKAVKITAYDLQADPVNPGLQFHKLDRAKDPRFWSVRVNRDIRIIVHRDKASLLLCYVGHHDKAYDWAQRRKLETHPRTGAAQFVEIRETVQEIPVPGQPQTQEKPEETARPPLFDLIPEEELLAYGIPPDWMADVRKATEDDVLELADHLPAEAAEALLELATGGRPAPVSPTAPDADPFTHPDAQRRFRVMSNVEELEQALEFPWEKWTVFLHPAQREVVERHFAGPVRISGSAGTGKTIVALHRAVHLARQHEGHRVLLTTFSATLANALREKLRRLIYKEPMLGERIDVLAMDELAQRLYRARVGDVRVIAEGELNELLDAAVAESQPTGFNRRFVHTEWHQVIDAWQIRDWEAYRNVLRMGRRTRVGEPQREKLWPVFSEMWKRLQESGRATESMMFWTLSREMSSQNKPYDHAIVDEAQDVSVAQLAFLATLAGDSSDGLFFAGDLGQRIFQAPYSWLSLGVDIRGRSTTLRVNYRTSHQIRSQADRLLDSQISDADGNSERRNETVSVFNGPPPVIRIARDADSECEVVAQWIKERIDQGYVPDEIGIFVRSESELERARQSVAAAGMAYSMLDTRMKAYLGTVSVGTMHLAKGLEFRAVAVMACDDEVIPDQDRIDTVGDTADLEEVYNTERHLLYVACTRARDELLISGVDPASEFIDDLRIIA